MKKIIFLTALIAFSYSSIAQQLYDTTQNKRNTNKLTAAEYFKKAKNQKTTAIVLSVGGVVIGTIGLAIGMKGFASGFDFQHPDEGESQMNTGSVLMIAGGAMIITAIPILIAGRHNEKKAKLMLGTGSVQRLSPNKIIIAGVAINF